MRCFGFNQIGSSCNYSEKHCSKFQKNLTVNKNNDNFETDPIEIYTPLTGACIKTTALNINPTNS